jgi:hypothetical protein
MDDADEIRDRGWRQGSALLPDSLPGDCVFEPALPDASGEAVFLILTQDCDLVQSDFEKEPFVELIRAVPVERTDGNLLYGKNPRRIHFRIGEITFEASCHERSRTSRRHLATCTPSAAHALDPLTLALLREWIAKRYTRPAFPDAFNERVRQGQNGRAIRKLLEREGHYFFDLYLSCNPFDRELPEGEPYEIMVWPTMGSEDYRDEEMRKAAGDACVDLEKLLLKCSGIRVNECSLRHEGQITLDDLHFFAPWDFDDLSHREKLTN